MQALIHSLEVGNMSGFQGIFVFNHMCVHVPARAVIRGITGTYTL